MNYMRYVLSDKGIKPDSKKIKAIEKIAKLSAGETYKYSCIR